MSTRLTAPPPPGTSPSRRRRFAALSALVALTVTGLAVPGRSASAYDEPGPVAGAATTEEPAPRLTLEGVTGEQVVTLVTGDRVRLSPAGGQYAVSPEPGPGRAPRFVTQSGPEGLYVYPDDALAAIQAGRVDQELFNVEYLAENGYADGATSRVPVIAQYPAGRSRTSITTAAQALPASTATRALESIGAAALNVPKSGASTFWAAVRGSSGQARLGAGLGTLWLDRKMTADLDQSVPMIGAPQAWAAGHDGTGVKVAVLDTGIDAEHPDLAGKVAASKSFVPGVSSVADGAGHGTHVASTIGGSGAAAGGKYKGVAPGVQLVIGKVLSDSGSGDMSWIIEGMEWAAASGAKVISMSLGGCCSDGTDPAAQAVNALTAQTGALFVVAAGNNGADETINSPGAADAALTVAAVDKSDHLAGFSSRGPRPGDSAAKPDIAAPGVNIVAARAAGTSMRGAVHVGEHYTTVSGTSMATPHVAGAAAITAQQHPDWTPDRIKSALMSTSKDDGYSVYQQGAGRLDLARSHRQQVFSTTPNADYKNVASDISGPVGRTVGYVNHGTAPVTLNLSATLRKIDGDPVDGRVSVDPALTIPAGGTATVTVTVDVTDLPFGRYSGAVVATEASGEVRLSTPIGLVREAPTYSLTVKSIGRDGKPASPYFEALVDVAGTEGVIGGHIVTEPGTVVTRVHAGTYSLTQLIDWVGEDSQRNTGWLLDPDVVVEGDTEVTLDARLASRLSYTTSRPAEAVAQYQESGFQRSTAGGQRYEFVIPTVGPSPVWAMPTEQPTIGEFRFFANSRLARPELGLTVLGDEPVNLHPFQQVHGEDGSAGDGHGYLHFAGTQDLTVVDVGRGTPEELAGHDLRGRLVLAHAGLEPGVFGPVCGIDVDRVEAIRAAGAKGIVAFPEAGSPCTVPLPTIQEPFTGPLRPVLLPRVSVSEAEGTALRARVAAGPVTVRVASTPESPYSYAFSPFLESRVPESLHFNLEDRNVARVDLGYSRAFTRGAGAADSLHVSTAGHGIALSVAIGRPHTGIDRTEFIGPLSEDVVYTRIVSPGRHSAAPGQPALIGQGEFGALERFTRPVHVRQRWLVGATTPGAAPTELDLAKIVGDAPLGGRMGEACVLCRQGDILFPMFFTTSVNDGHGRHDGMNRSPAAEDFHDYTVRLFKDGTEIPKGAGAFGLPKFDLPAEPGTYRLTADGPSTDTTWTFSSSRPTEDAFRTGYLCTGVYFGTDAPCRPEPVLFVGYDLGGSLDRNNAVAAGRTHRFRVNVTQPQTLTAPDVTGLKVWTSTDDGARWAPAQVKKSSDGSYTVQAHYPSYDRTAGAVSVKVEAWNAGSRVEQTSSRVFPLRAG